MERYLIKFMTDAGFIHEISVPVDEKVGGQGQTLDAFRRARHLVATKNPGIGNLTLFAIERGYLTDVGWSKIRDAVVVE